MKMTVSDKSYPPKRRIQNQSLKSFDTSGEIDCEDTRKKKKVKKDSLEKLVLKGHVGLNIQTNASAEDVGKSSSLFSKCVDNWGSRWGQRGLEHVGEDGQHWVELLVLLGGSGARVSLPGDAGHHFGNDGQVQNEWRSKERVLANVGHGDGLVSTEEDLSIVLIQSALGITNSWHVLDDDGVVWVLIWGIEDAVGGNHIVDNVGLGDLLGAESLLLGQVAAVVVSEMVVGSNGGELDTGVDEEINEGRLHLGLTRLEVITTNVRTVALSKVDNTWDEGVLWGTVDEWNTLLNTSNGEDGGWSNFIMTSLDSGEDVVGGVVDTIDELSVTLSVGSPEDNDLVEVVLGLEVTNVLADNLNVLLLGAWKNVVGTVTLVGSNEVWVVNGRKWLVGSHLLANLTLEIWLKDSGAVHGISQVHGRDIPTTENEVIGVNHWEDLMERNVDLLAGSGISTKLDGGSHDDRAIVVGSLCSGAGLPSEVFAVGNDTGGDSGTVVTTPSNKHETGLWNLALSLEVIDGLDRLGNVLAIGSLGDLGGTVGVGGLDGVLSVDDFIGANGDKVIDNGSRAVGRAVSGTVCVRCHCD